MAAPIIDVPQEGQIVEVRGERWAVTDVAPQGLPRSSADDPVAGLQHAVALQSIAEDRLGEELRVVWELEPGRAVVPEQGMPERVDADHFDDPSTLAAFVDALRWGALTSADTRTVQAPFRSGATVEAYQLEPLRRALRTPRTNLLLADDVGLGKTIEAGLVVQELLLRHRARSVIIVCPAGLVLKWQDEMREKFGLEFQVVDSAAMREIRRSHGLHANPFSLYPRVIVSMSWLPGQRAQRLLQQVQARSADRKSARRFAFDVLVVDEAHHVAPSAPHSTQGRRGYAVDSQRTNAVRELANACEHRLFLSATPHNGYTESFAALLAMIDPQRFARGAAIDPGTLREVAVRRLKRDLAGQKGFPERKVAKLAFEPTDAEADAYDQLIAFTQRREKAASGDAQKARDLATLILKKRFFSSPVAFARTVDAYLGTRLSSVTGDIPDYDDVLGVDADDVEEGLFDQPEQTALRSTGRAMPPLTKDDVADLERLSAWGHGYQGRPDSRLNAVLTYLEANVRPDGHWSNERVVIFTEYVDTLEWIQEVLASRGYDQKRLAVITGGTDRDERELTRERFNEPPENDDIRVLLATDAAGEGIDLQRHCHRLINFDIPFNPNRLEQRIGRIDRYGQEHDPEIYHLVPVGAGSGYADDTEFLTRVAVKIARVEVDLGSANEIIAPDIQRTIGGMKVQAAVGRRAAKDEQAVNEVLHGSRSVGRDLTDLEEQLASSRERLHIRPENLTRVVQTALALDNQPLLAEVGDDRTDAAVWELPASLSRSWTPVTKGLDNRLDPGRLRPVTFDEQAAVGRSDLVHVHLGHQLVQRSARLLRSALWGSDSKINRVSAVVVEGLDESFVAAVTRLVLVGRGGLRLHEEVFLAGTRLDKRQALGAERSETLLEQALDGSRLTLAPETVRRRLADTWNDGDLRRRVQAAVVDRAERRRAQVEEQLGSAQKADLARVDQIFDGFARTLKQALADAEAAKAEAEHTLFEVETRQRERDLREIRRRLDDLDDERQRERDAVSRRYEDVTHYTFAGAIVFALTPEAAR